MEHRIGKKEMKRMNFQHGVILSFLIQNEQEKSPFPERDVLSYIKKAFHFPENVIKKGMEYYKEYQNFSYDEKEKIREIVTKFETVQFWKSKKEYETNEEKEREKTEVLIAFTNELKPFFYQEKKLAWWEKWKNVWKAE